MEKLSPNARVNVDIKSLREEPIPPEEGGHLTRFCIPLQGTFGVAWIESFYRLQWAGVDDIGYHLSKNCREIYFEQEAQPEAREWLPGTLGNLEKFIARVNSDAAAEANQAA